MKLIDALKSVANVNVIRCGDRWMFFDPQSEMFIVNERGFKQKKVRLVIETNDEETAVNALIKGK